MCASPYGSICKRAFCVFSMTFLSFSTSCLAFRQNCQACGQIMSTLTLVCVCMCVRVCVCVCAVLVCVYLCVGGTLRLLSSHFHVARKRPNNCGLSRVVLCVCVSR